VDEPESVHVTHALSQLLEDVAGALLCHPLALVWLLQAVLEQVAPLCVLGHDVGLTIELEAVEDFDDAVALFAHSHGINFRDSILLCQLSVLLGVDCLDGDELACEFV
jgi:hypothetical protein